MKICAVIEKGIETGSHIIMVDKKESQDLITIFEEYYEQNKRKKNAQKFLKSFTENLLCY